MKKIIKISAALVLTVVSLSSCLKDNSVELSPEKGTNVIEWANPAQRAVNTSILPLYTISYDLGADVVKTLTVSYSGPELAAPEDITVNFAVSDTSNIGKYNRNQDQHYELMPQSNYVLTTNSVVIKKGTNKANFDITFKPDKFDLAKALVLPLTISSVSSGTISGNFNTILLNVGAKNAYDGLYDYTTSANTSLQPNLKRSGVPLVTTGARTVQTNLLDTYSNIAVYDIDPVTFQVRVLAGLGGIINDPVSKWDPAKKILYVKWKTATRQFEETYTYTGPR